MAGEFTVKDWTADNIGLVNFQPGQAVILDIANSTGGTVAVKLPTGVATELPVGVIVDKTKLSSIDQSVMAGQGVAIRSIPGSMIWVLADSAIAVGDKVGTSGATTPGNVKTIARAGAGAQPTPILGIALTAAASSGQTVIVLLLTGSSY